MPDKFRSSSAACGHAWQGRTSTEASWFDLQSWLLETVLEEGQELARTPERVALARADVLDEAAQPVALGIVVALRRRPDPDHERLHTRLPRSDSYGIGSVHSEENVAAYPGS